MKKLFALFTYSLIVLATFGQDKGVNATDFTVSDGDWNTPGIWNSGSVPLTSSGDDLTIYHDVTVTVNWRARNGSVTIAPGASVTHSSGVAWGERNGSITVNGTYIDEGGSYYISGCTWTVNSVYERDFDGGSLPAGLVWGGSSILYLSGVTNNWPTFQTDAYNDLVIDCSGLTTDLELSSSNVSKFNNISITNTGSYALLTDAGDLTTVSGDLTIGTNGKLVIGATDKLTVNGSLTNAGGVSSLVIESNATRTGSLIADQAVSGTFHQYFANGRWYLVTPPFSGVDSYDFWDGVNSAFIRPYNSPGDGWGDYYTSPAVGLNVGQGYEYWQDAAPITVSTSGTFITGAQTLSVSSGGSTNANYNLIGNPYPCGLDWSQVADRTHVDGSSFYVYTGTGYKTHNGTSGTATSSIIPSYQGFFVEYDNTGDISIANDDKAHAGVSIYKSVNTDYSNHFKVKAQFDGQESDCVIYQQAEATNGADAIYDASVLFNNDPYFMEIYSLAGEKKSVINIYGEYPYIVNLGFRVPEGGGEFTLEPYDFRNLDGAFSIQLEDTESGDIIDFNENSSYVFTMSEGGMIEDRIVLHLNSTVGIDEEIGDGASIYANKNIVYIDYNNSENYNVQIINMMGQTIYEGQKSDNVLTTISLDQPAAYYIVRLVSEQNTITKKLYIAK